MIPSPSNGYRPFACSACAAGSVPSTTGTGHVCLPIDTCLFDNGGCSSNPLVQCTFAGPGVSTICDACPDGFTGDGRTCIDINECGMPSRLHLYPLAQRVRSCVIGAATNNGGCDSDACWNYFGGFICLAPDQFLTQCDTANNGGCDLRTVCTENPQLFSGGGKLPSCGGCQSNGDAANNTKFPAGYARPFAANSTGSENLAAGIGGRCPNVNECLMNPCGPNTICIDKSPDPIYGYGPVPAGARLNYDGYLCQCASNTQFPFTDPLGAYGIPNQPGCEIAAKCSGADVNGCDPHAACNAANLLNPCHIDCAAGYYGSGLVNGGCVKLNSCGTHARQPTLTHRASIRRVHRRSLID